MTLGQGNGLFPVRRLLTSKKRSPLKFKGGKYSFRARRLSAGSSLSGNRESILLSLSLHLLDIIGFSYYVRYYNDSIFKNQYTKHTIITKFFKRRFHLQYSLDESILLLDVNLCMILSLLFLQKYS